MKDEKLAPERPSAWTDAPRKPTTGAQAPGSWGTVYRPPAGAPAGQAAGQAPAGQSAGPAAAIQAPRPPAPVRPPGAPRVELDKYQVLRARARALAREPLARSAPEGRLEVVEFVLSGERYAVQSTLVREVYPLKDLTPLPCTPAFVLGIINLRGQILAVMDVRRFFDLPLKGITDLNKVIVLQTGEVQVGILADAVVGVRAIPLSELQPPLPTMTGVRATYLRGVTSDRLAVLDVAKVLADEKIMVHEEVEA